MAVQDTALLRFDEINPAGHSVLPTFYFRGDVYLGDTNVYSDSVKNTLSKTFVLRCTSAELPQPVHDGIQVVAKRFIFPEQGIVRRNGQITLTAFDTNDAEIMKAVHDVYDELFSPQTGEMTNSGGKHKDHKYKIGATLRLYSNYNEADDNNIASFIIRRALIQDFNVGGQLTDGSSPDYFRPTLTLAYGTFDKEFKR